MRRNETSTKGTGLLAIALALLLVSIGAAGTAFAASGDPPPATPGTDDPPLDIPDPEEDTGPLADIKTVVRAAFRACLETSETVGFNQYLDLVHPERKLTGKAIRGIRYYSWAKFRHGCTQWLSDRERLTFEVVRTRPPQLTEETTRVKVYFRAQRDPAGGGPRRYDAPMEFQKKDGRWMLWQNSL